MWISPNKRVRFPRNSENPGLVPGFFLRWRRKVPDIFRGCSGVLGWFAAISALGGLEFQSLGVMVDLRRLLIRGHHMALIQFQPDTGIALGLYPMPAGFFR